MEPEGCVCEDVVARFTRSRRLKDLGSGLGRNLKLTRLNSELQAAATPERAVPRQNALSHEAIDRGHPCTGHM